MGTRFTWHTDHEGLKWLRNTRDPRGRYARWIEELEEFDFEVRYRPGVQNPHADALSRVPVANLIRDGEFSVAEFQRLQQADPILSSVISMLRRGRQPKLFSNQEVKRWARKWDYLILDDYNGLLYIQYTVGKHLVNQLVVPEVLVPQVLTLKHDKAGHMGAQKTTKLVQREYFWLDMLRDIKEYCKSCVSCTVSKPPHPRPQAPLTLTSQPTEPWQEISIDLKGPFGTKPTSRGNRYVLVAIDLMTRAAEMVPIPDKTAKTVASALVREVFCRHGIPESFLSDRGLEFENQGLTTLAENLGIDKKRISPLHPQANVVVERLNRTIGNMLRKSVDKVGENWDLEIPFV